jgi:cytochrome c-type biogenesis protein CcmH
MNDALPKLREQLRDLKQMNASGQLDKAAFDTARTALEAQLLDAVIAAPQATPTMGRGWVWAGVGALVLAVGGGMIWKAASRPGGTPAAQAAATPAAAAAPTGSAPGAMAAAAPHGVAPPQIESMVGQLVARLQSQPDDADGWNMLGRTYMSIKRYPDAVAAYERAAKLRPGDADTLADYADALAVSKGGQLEGEPARLLEAALKLQPDHLKALALSGTAAFNRSDFAAAVQFWDRTVQVGPADSPIVAMARGGAAEARQRGKLAPAKLP